eukprot:6739179-Heterocapsa_arctica.AAC.1
MVGAHKCKDDGCAGKRRERGITTEDRREEERQEQEHQEKASTISHRHDKKESGAGKGQGGADIQKICWTTRTK